MLVAFIMLGFVGFGFLKMEKYDPTHAQNFPTRTANAIAENAFYYCNTALHYAGDNYDPLKPSFSIEDAELDDYMLDKVTRSANETFKTLNDHNAYFATANDTAKNSIKYVLVSWQPLDTKPTTYHPVGIAYDSYGTVNGVIMSELTRLVNQQNQQENNKYLSYVVGVVDTSKGCNPDALQIYSAETEQIDYIGGSTINKTPYKNIYAELCTSIGADKIGSNVIFRRIAVTN